LSLKKRVAILSMATCVVLSGMVAVSGCGVRAGMEKVHETQQVKKQVEKKQHEFEKKLQEGQENLEDQ